MEQGKDEAGTYAAMQEAGAWPEYWISGGYTSGGVPEAVIDQIKLREYTISDIYPKS